MKKIYLSGLFASLTALALSQSFFVPTSYRGAFAPAPEAMWTDGWTNWDPQNTNYGTSNVTVTTNITTNTTWTANNIYLLQGQIYVKNGATLTIQPGTVVMGDKNVPGSGLFITQGSNLVAQGTATAPIVFTSNQAAGTRAPGDWGGIIILGTASNNQPGGVANIEGLAPTPDTQFGGGASPDDNDNSGILTYVRIEFSGFAYQTDREINALTMGSVGRATTIHHIQVSFGNDDAFEWFGGTVNSHHLVSYRNLDDDFDTDFGYRGNVQFGLIVRDPNLADNPSVSTSEGFESDNDASGSASTPQTSPIFSNITAIGPFRGNNGNTIAPGYRRGARLRRNTALKLYNSIFMDFARGIHIDGTAAETNANNGTLKYMNNIVAGTTVARVCERNSGSTFPIWTWFGSNNNDSLASPAGILVNPYVYLTPDYRPAGAIALGNSNFTDATILPFVLTAPVATAIYNYCVGATANQLSATAGAGNSLVWYTTATGGTGSTSAPTPSTASAGVFNYYVAQANAEGTEGPRTQITVTVNALPATPSVTPNGPTSFCTGGSVDLTATSANAYAWTNNPGTTQTITVSTSGSYAVTITDANGCQATSAPINVNVSNAPTPTIQASGATAICSGDTVTLTSSAADSYLWSNGLTTQSIQVTTAGTYNVTTTNANACDGVGQSSDIVVTVGVTPTATVSSVTVNGIIVTFTNGSTNATSYSWDFGDFTNSSATSPTHAYAISDTYTVTMTAINGNCSDDTTFTVSITVGLDELSAFGAMSLFPNPTADQATLSFELQSAQAVEAVLMNVNGQIVQTIANEEMTQGTHDLQISTVDLEAGVYFAVIRAGETTQTLRLSVIK
jgi:PKD repeat protein